MDPWFEILNNPNEAETESRSDFLNLVYEMVRNNIDGTGNLDYIDLSKLAPPASKEVVKSLKKTAITEKTDEKCSICLREFESGDTQVTMPCKHNFHDQCILIWLEKTNSCPVCRHELKTDDPVYEEQQEYKRKQKIREENVETLHNSMYS